VRRNADQSIDSKVTSAQPPPSLVHPLAQSLTHSLTPASCPVITLYSHTLTPSTVPLHCPFLPPYPHHTTPLRPLYTTALPRKHNMSDTKAPEFEPPQACVNRVIKSVLPDNVQVTKDARVRVSLCYYSTTSLCHYLTVTLPHCNTTSL
jgi:hypothetical protein